MAIVRGRQTTQIRPTVRPGIVVGLVDVEPMDVQTLTLVVPHPVPLDVARLLVVQTVVRTMDLPNQIVLEIGIVFIKIEIVAALLLVAVLATLQAVDLVPLVAGILTADLVPVAGIQIATTIDIILAVTIIAVVPIALVAQIAALKIIAQAIAVVPLVVMNAIALSTQTVLLHALHTTDAVEEGNLLMHLGIEGKINVRSRLLRMKGVFFLSQPLH